MNQLRLGDIEAYFPGQCTGSEAPEYPLQGTDVLTVGVGGDRDGEVIHVGEDQAAGDALM